VLDRWDQRYAAGTLLILEVSLPPPAFYQMKIIFYYLNSLPGVREGK
jgi:hypothetical protein